LGLGRGFCGPIPTAYAADIASPQDYERTMAIYRTVSDAGWVIGPIMLGWLKDVSSVSFSFFLGAGLLFVAIVCFALLAKETISHNR
jgi:MFS family permease